MEQRNIAFIGAGNMARSLAGGLINGGYPASRLCAADPNPDQRAALASALGIVTTASNAEAAADADILVLAVKPQSMRAAVAALAPQVDARRLIISIAAGIRTATLTQWLGAAAAVVRAMPNTPALVGSGATALYATPSVTAMQRSDAEAIMRGVGLAVWLETEADMDAVTALSGCGPAYFFLLMECLEEAARGLGMEARLARLLTLHTAFGAAKLALESDEDSAALRRRVTSPGGATEQALKVLESGDLRKLFHQALAAAKRRAEALADELGVMDG